MSASQSKIVSSFPKAFQTVLLCGSEAIAIGNGDIDDVITVKPLKKPVTAPSLFIKGKPNKLNSPSPKELYERYRSLLDRGSVGSFSISRKTVQRVKLASTKLQATHLRFHSNNDGIHLTLFDLRRFIPEARLKRKREVMLVTETISTQDRYRFSTTFSAASFCSLPVADILVAVDPHGITKLSYDDGSFYLLRDQAITLPITAFSIDPLGKEIAFWLYSKSGSPDPHTIP